MNLLLSTLIYHDLFLFFLFQFYHILQLKMEENYNVT